MPSERPSRKGNGERGARKQRQKQWIAGTVLCLVGVVLLTACSGGGHPPPRTVPVEVTKAKKMNVPLQVKAIGNVEAYTTVAVKSQVNGEIAAVHFREGQDVAKDALLFTIDPRPFKAALRQAESALARDRAQAKNAREESDRYSGLVEKGFVSRQEYDRARTNADALDAVVQADEAAVENARLQLAYTAIRSPIAGRTGGIQVQQGNVVKANDIALVTINQVVPINVAFAVPEQELTAIKRFRAAGALRVLVSVPQSERDPLQGRLVFIDNAVNTQTGTIQLKATFPNRNHALWPGQFVDVIIVLTVERDRTVVPQSAVQTGQQGPYVYAVKEDGTAELKQVTIARTFDEWAVIGTGVAAGETVVTEGQLRLVPGVKVQVKSGTEKKDTTEEAQDSQGKQHD